MSNPLDIKPLNKELPSDFADRLGIYYTQQVTTDHKKVNGQFFTPIPIARLLASFCTISKSRVKILDPGCGIGILSCALIEYIVTDLLGSQARCTQTIAILPLEIDDVIFPVNPVVLSCNSGVSPEEISNYFEDVSYGYPHVYNFLGDVHPLDNSSCNVYAATRTQPLLHVALDVAETAK